MNDDDLMDTHGVQEMTGLSRATVNRARKNAELHAHKFGRAVRFARRDVRAWVANHKQK